eukprot:5314260-Pyramimonas_sp.AAC.1
MKLPNERDQRHCSERLTTATRHEPYYKDDISFRFTEYGTSFDVLDGWVCLSDLLGNWPPKNEDIFHDHHLGAARKCFRGRHWACQALTVLKMRDGRPQFWHAKEWTPGCHEAQVRRGHPPDLLPAVQPWAQQRRH